MSTDLILVAPKSIFTGGGVAKHLFLYPPTYPFYKNGKKSYRKTPIPLQHPPTL